MEHLSFEERNLLERRTFHGIQLKLRYCRIILIILIVIGLVDVCFSFNQSYKKYLQFSKNTHGAGGFIPIRGHPDPDAGEENNASSSTPSMSYNVMNQQANEVIRSEVYNIAVMVLFFVINSFAMVAILMESFQLITTVTIFNVGIFLLSFTADNSLPHGLIFKLILLFIIHMTILFFLLMKSRRIS